MDPERPTVTLKIALDSAGGVDDESDDESFRFTCGASLDMVHRLRSVSDAVLVGVSTVARDDPTLTVRRVALPADRVLQPLRVVMDRSLRTPPTAALVQDEHRTVIFAGIGDDVARAAEVQAAAQELQSCGRGVKVQLLDTSTATGLREALRVLKAQHGVQHVMVEGGPFTARAFLVAALVDRAIVVRAPVTFTKPVPSGE